MMRTSSAGASAAKCESGVGSVFKIAANASLVVSPSNGFCPATISYVIAYGALIKALVLGLAYNNIRGDHQRRFNFVKLINSDDIRIIQSRCRSGLLLKAVQSILVFYD